MRKNKMTELTPRQIAAINAVKTFFNKRYTYILPEVLENFKTDPEQRRKWGGYTVKEKREHLQEHVGGLKGRRAADIGKIVAPELTSECRTAIVKLTLRRAVEDGSLTREERDEELHYRRSVCGKLVYENDPKDGSEAFGWNEERKNKRREQLRQVFAENMGLTLYDDDSELLLLIRLAENKEYQHPKGTMFEGHPDWRKIQGIMADSGYNRTSRALRVVYSKIKTGRKNILITK